MSAHRHESESALEIWRSARCAAGEPPTPERVRRVADKLSDTDALLLVETRHATPAGMLLAESFRTATEAPDPVAIEGTGHVSMVFVHPDHRRRGVGRTLIRRLQCDGRWRQLNVWTRESNHAAQTLYRSCGFATTTEVTRLGSHGEVRRWHWSADETSA